MEHQRQQPSRAKEMGVPIMTKNQQHDHADNQGHYFSPALAWAAASAAAVSARTLPPVHSAAGLPESVIVLLGQFLVGHPVQGQADEVGEVTQVRPRAGPAM